MTTVLVSSGTLEDGVGEGARRFALKKTNWNGGQNLPIAVVLKIKSPIKKTLNYFPQMVAYTN